MIALKEPVIKEGYLRLQKYECYLEWSIQPILEKVKYKSTQRNLNKTLNTDALYTGQVNTYQAIDFKGRD
jgi:hypothetical protein